jgi:hypothetical protein
MMAVRRRQLTRVGVWIALATVAVMTVILTARTETGVRRIATLITPESSRTAKAAFPMRQIEQEAEQRRLSEAIRTLAADRDKLLARINTLERNLEDVTGSIPPKAAAPSAPVVAAPLATPQAAVPSPPQPTGSGQTRIGAGHLATGTSTAAESTATKTEFGVDVGGNASMEGLRTLWITLKTTQPALFEGLRPIIAVREGKAGAVELRLVAGPLPNASIAARLCATLSAVSQSCQPTVFDGQRLALQ